jgi:hypothetical protein
MRRSSIAVCISRIVDSTTIKGCLFAGRGLWAARSKATVAKTRECVIAILPLGKNGREAYHVVVAETKGRGEKGRGGEGASSIKETIARLFDARL